MFIVVDGIDGAGKTTLVRQLAEFLSEFEPTTTKEPTAQSKWGRELRQSAKFGRLPKAMELEYFHKDRLFHIETVILPAIRAGHVVISDRYVDSTLAFQADGPADADRLYRLFAPEILTPDLSFILVCPVSVGLARIQANRGTLSTFEKVSTLERARSIYESRSGRNYAFLDASGSIERTFTQAISEISSRFPEIFKDCSDAHQGVTRLPPLTANLKAASNC